MRLLYWHQSPSGILHQCWQRKATHHDTLRMVFRRRREFRGDAISIVQMATVLLSLWSTTAPLSCLSKYRLCWSQLGKSLLQQPTSCCTIPSETQVTGRRDVLEGVLHSRTCANLLPSYCVVLMGMLGYVPMLWFQSGGQGSHPNYQE